MKMKRVAAVLVLSVFGVLGTASAAAVGTLNVINCPGGGVTFNQTSIDWTLPVSGGNGCIKADALTNVTFLGGVGDIVPTELGLISDPVFIPVPNGVSLITTGTNFIFFSGAPGIGALSFDLTDLGPGVALSCTAGMAIGAECKPDGVGPFLISRTATGSSIAVSAIGTVNDGIGPISPWSGSITIPFDGLSPIDIQNFLDGIADANTGLGCSEPGGAFTGLAAVIVTSVRSPSAKWVSVRLSRVRCY